MGFRRRFTSLKKILKSRLKEKNAAIHRQILMRLIKSLVQWALERCAFLDGSQYGSILKCPSFITLPNSPVFPASPKFKSSIRKIEQFHSKEVCSFTFYNNNANA